MSYRFKIIFEILLVIVAIYVLIYNFYYQREIVYMASIVAVFGTIIILVRDILKLKNRD